VKLKGGHRFDGDIKHLIDVIQKDMPAAPVSPTPAP
jgi:type IV secretory pathway VirJ component